MVLLYALFVSFLWGLQPVLHKHVLNNVDPVAVLVVGGALYSACLLAVAIMHLPLLRHEIKKITPGIFLWLCVTSILCGLVANMIYLYVLKKHRSSYVASALMYTSPAFALLIAYIFLKESVTKMSLLGVALIVTGIVVVTQNISA